MQIKCKLEFLSQASHISNAHIRQIIYRTFPLFQKALLVSSSLNLVIVVSFQVPLENTIGSFKLLILLISATELGQYRHHVIILLDFFTSHPGEQQLFKNIMANFKQTPHVYAFRKSKKSLCKEHPPVRWLQWNAWAGLVSALFLLLHSTLQPPLCEANHA